MTKVDVLGMLFVSSALGLMTTCVSHVGKQHRQEACERALREAPEIRALPPAQTIDEMRHRQSVLQTAANCERQKKSPG